MKIKKEMRQVGAFVYGSGINIRAFADEAIKRGFAVLFCEGHAELYK